jgi:hypothetical protein
MKAHHDEWRQDMSAQPDKLSTADMVAAGQRPPDAESGQDMPSNVRRLERPQGEQRAEGPGALLDTPESADLRRQWESIQIGFVDQPRRAVEEADGLVAQTMKRVAEVFANERSQLERQWSEGQDVSTEELRVALTRYRAFFDRLLAA